MNKDNLNIFNKRISFRLDENLVNRINEISTNDLSTNSETIRALIKEAITLRNSRRNYEL
jgi:metal-responsive CopG/Arc/MetJ family transcriptional regulator